MKHSSLDFESAPRYRFFGRMSALGMVIGCSALLVAAGWTASQLWRSWQQFKSNEQTQQYLQNLNREIDAQQTTALRSIKKAADQSQLSEEQRRGLNLAIRQLNTPWAGILTQIEQATPKDIALIQIEPEGKLGIKLQAESKSLDALLAYAASLQQRGVFGNLAYTKHETNDQDPNKPVRLSFQLTWQGVASKKSETPVDRPLSAATPDSIRTSTGIKP